MKTEIPVEQLLRWRLAKAENEAPPAPRAAQLLEQTRPWWEVWPERFQSLVEQLSHMQIAYGHAMTESNHARTGHPVTALVDHAGQDIETSVRGLYLNVRERRFCFRFQLNTTIQPPVESFDATFISEKRMSPLFSAPATRSVDNEYRVDVPISEELARDWAELRVTDKMPFRLILRSSSGMSVG